MPFPRRLSADDPGRRFPPELTKYRYGDHVFGVYLAVERSRSARELARAKEELRATGR